AFGLCGPDLEGRGRLDGRGGGRRQPRPDRLVRRLGRRATFGPRERRRGDHRLRVRALLLSGRTCDLARDAREEPRGRARL
ncbi:MAG: hypothetical protein AVDCRST_MAG12-1587, partial [uncultured Rubrobacteraceae bacterium]